MTASDPADPVPPASLLVDPSVAGPDILFSTGTVSADGTENYSRVLPDIVGIADRYWNLTQWNAPGGIFDPAAPDAPGTIRDPLLGASLASWRTGGEPGATSSFAVFGTANDATFRLAAAGGTLRDTFLQSTGYAPGTLSFDRNLVFDARERLSAASAGGGNAYAFNGFTVFFNLPDNPHYDPSLFTTEIFLQAPLTDSRGEPGAFQTLAAGQDWQAIYDLSSENAAGNDDSVATLDYVADPGALHDVRLDLSAAMRRMTAAMARLDPAMATQLTDLSRWSLGSVYIGVESNGDGGADPAALALDVAHPTVFSTADAGTNGAVQTIDGGSYAVSTADARIATAAGTVNTLRLSGLPGGQDVASRGTDTVLVGNGQADTLHALGGSLCVQGDVSSWGRVSVDGDAPILVAGRFADLSVSGGGAGTTVSASVSGTANLFLSGFGARVDLSGAANASLSGASASFAAGAGTVSLFADGAAVDGNGPGTQTVFVDGHDGTVTQTGSGRQVIVDSPTDSGRLDVSGGAGQQEIWTGNADVHVSAAPAAVPGASLTLLAQHGSTAALSLGGEAATAINQGGTLTVSGAPGIAGGAGTATVFAEGGSTTIAGGGEALVAVMCGGDLSITAGTGNQQIFGGDRATGSLAVMASPTASGGSQTVVDANATVFGGRTNQTIWTGTADDVVVASNRAADAGGHIALLVQGGTSSYWGGTESAQLDNTGGILDAFLGGDGADRIGVDMAATGGGITILHGFDPARDTLLLRGLPASPDVLHVSTADGATTLAFGTSRVVFADTPAPVASATAGGLLFGHG